MADEERTPWQGWRRKGEDAGLPAAKGPGSRRTFGATWWGRAWLDALEQRARLDPGRLSRGRSYARRGSVLELTVAAGEVQAIVQGSRSTPYQVTVRIRAFSTTEWDAVLKIVSTQIGRVAALLDGELPPEVVDDVRATGLDLLPGAGEIHTHCTCPDFAVPCKHSAAVCYLIADALDEDPFALLHLRGRSKQDLLTTLRTRRSHPTTTLPTSPRPRGIPALAAFATHALAPVDAAASSETGSSGDATSSGETGGSGETASSGDSASSGEAGGSGGAGGSGEAGGDAPTAGDARTSGAVGGRGGVAVPAVGRVLGKAGTPVAVRVLEPPRGSGIEVRELVALAADAAQRAWELASGNGDGALDLTFEQDLARRASHVLGTPDLADLAHRAGISARQLTTWAAAWHEAGPSGLTVTLDDPHDAAPEAVTEAEQALQPFGPTTTQANRVTAGKLQLRLGKDNLWYRFDLQFNDWTLTRPPTADPQDLL
ncbi:SWIM zinc finger family protein [Kribbella solani]|uniref:Putative Zn finger protein n=1 Tax=Kribbella solani TaxID=236067 RepID=A0A841DF81_9ACTN|nr:putative Zn finger protein [Kribbella solani]